MKKQKHYVLTELHGPGGYYNDRYECPSQTRYAGGSAHGSLESRRS
jgi:hypothetical protein